MSAPIQVMGPVDSTGHVEITQRVELPAGEVVITIQPVTPDMIAVDDALWDEQFKRAPFVLAAISAEIQASITEDTAEDFDPDTDKL
ncbi:MAG: hypothetical protein ACYDBJ_21060 [Aggregatilineales bacterium]